MKKSDKIFARTKESILLIVLLVLCIPKVVYADSSWIWFTTTAPYQLLPFVAVLTIVIEYLMIKNILHIQNKKRVLIAVCISNLVSFMVPYFATYYQDGVYETIKQTFESMDFYTINSAYLFLTLIIECPIDIVNENGIWKANYNVKYREPKWGDTYKKKVKNGTDSGFVIGI